MPRNKLSIAELVNDKRLDEIVADLDEARDMLEHAETHLRSAEKLLDEDPSGAYQLLYDAARKAASADMLARGYRAKSDRPGAHAAVVLYAEEALASEDSADALANFDRIRRSRNRTEYGTLRLPRSQLEADLGHARTIVESVRARLNQQRAGEKP